MGPIASWSFLPNERGGRDRQMCLEWVRSQARLQIAAVMVELMCESPGEIEHGPFVAVTPDPDPSPFMRRQAIQPRRCRTDWESSLRPLRFSTMFAKPATSSLGRSVVVMRSMRSR